MTEPKSNRMDKTMQAHEYNYHQNSLKYLCGTILCALFLPLILGAAESPLNFDTDGKRHCGPLAIVFSLSWFGQEASWQDFVEQGAEPEQGMSMYAISQALQKNGLHTLGVKCNWKDLEQPRQPILALLWIPETDPIRKENHFLIVWKSPSDGTLQAYDPPTGVFTVDPLVQKRLPWKGHCLWIAEHKEHLPTLSTN